MDNHSPLYNANGYTVFHVTATSAHLSFSLTPEPHFRFHRNARLMHRSETEGILMRFPLNMIFQLGDLLMLWTCYEVEYNYPLVTSFIVHDATAFRLRVVISVRYDNSRLSLLSEPLPDNENHSPVDEVLTVQLATTSTFRYHVLVLHEESHDDQWQFVRLQPTLLSPGVILIKLEHNMDAVSSPGIYCLGPSDPWDMVASANTDPAVYWLPTAVYESASSDAREMIRAQVSNCLPWAFVTPTHTVRYLVHNLL